MGSEMMCRPCNYLQLLAAFVRRGIIPPLPNLPLSISRSHVSNKLCAYTVLASIDIPASPGDVLASAPCPLTTWRHKTTVRIGECPPSLPGGDRLRANHPGDPWAGKVSRGKSVLTHAAAAHTSELTDACIWLLPLVGRTGCCILRFKKYTPQSTLSYLGDADVMSYWPRPSYRWPGPSLNHLGACIKQFLPRPGVDPNIGYQTSFHPFSAVRSVVPTIVPFYFDT